MKIQILGTGCAKCKALTAATEQAAQALGLPFELEKVTDLQRIMSFGVMMTPALVVDGKVKVAGKIPNLNELKTMLVLRTVMGTKKTVVYVALVIVMATITGLIYGALF